MLFLLLSFLLIVFPLVLTLSDLFFSLYFSHACGKNKYVSMALSMLQMRCFPRSKLILPLTALNLRS